VRHHERAGHGAGAHDGVEHGERDPCAVERSGDEEGQCHAQVEEEEPDAGEHREADPEPRDRRDVGEPLAHLATGARLGRLPEELILAHHDQTGDHREVGDRVEGEAPAEADARDQRARQRRTRNLRQGDDRAVEDDRVRQVVLRHHLRDEGAPERVVESQEDTAHEGKRIQHDERRMGQERQDGDRRRLSHLEALRHEQRSTLVGPIGHRAGPCREHDQRPELAGGERADSEAALSQLEHEQDQRDVGELVARIRDQLADEEEPEVVGRERLERLAERGPRQTAGDGRGGRLGRRRGRAGHGQRLTRTRDGRRRGARGARSPFRARRARAARRRSRWLGRARRHATRSPTRTGGCRPP
jgi:hypothetical protein